MRNIEIGILGENIATKHLKRNKYKIVERNVHISHNEIDIITKNKNYIVFVEVKTRSVDNSLYSEFGTPASAVTQSKQRRTINAARTYLKNNKFSNLQPRFDVIEVYIDKTTRKILKINHIENAFGVLNT